MINVLGVDLDFDITSPTDMVRYKEAGERMEAEGQNLSMPTMATDDPGFLDAYIDMLNAQLRLFADFLDDVFGDGIAMELLGANPSLNRITEINDAIGDALEKQGGEFGGKLAKYQPNRETRRANKM